jgi:DNA-binding response OmpR family regulator
MRILITEDVPEIRDLVVEVLQDAGHEVAAVADYETATGLVENGTWDLLIADVVVEREQPSERNHPE